MARYGDTQEVKGLWESGLEISPIDFAVPDPLASAEDEGLRQDSRPPRTPPWRRSTPSAPPTTGYGAIHEGNGLAGNGLEGSLLASAMPNPPQAREPFRGFRAPWAGLIHTNDLPPPYPPPSLLPHARAAQWHLPSLIDNTLSSDAPAEHVRAGHTTVPSPRPLEFPLDFPSLFPSYDNTTDSEIDYLPGCNGGINPQLLYISNPTSSQLNSTNPTSHQLTSANLTSLELASTAPTSNQPDSTPHASNTRDYNSPANIVQWLNEAMSASPSTNSAGNTPPENASMTHHPASNAPSANSPQGSNLITPASPFGHHPSAWNPLIGTTKQQIECQHVWAEHLHGMLPNGTILPCGRCAVEPKDQQAWHCNLCGDKQVPGEKKWRLCIKCMMVTCFKTDEFHMYMVGWPAPQ